MAFAITLDEALLLALLGAPLLAFVIGVIAALILGRKHLRTMREMSADFRAKQERVERSMRRGARMTDHRLKP